MGRNKMTLALKLLEKSAKSEYLPAVRELVFWQFRRYRKKWKIQELMKWAEVGSARGDMLSKAILGVYYIREKKIHEGLKLIFVSAKSGNPAGQYALQECIKNKLVKGTEAQVQQLLTASADQGFYYATAFGN
jgi:hypothetical protein